MNSWFGSAYDAASAPQSGGDSAASLAAAFNNIATTGLATAGQAFNTYQTGQTQVELAKLKQANIPVAQAGAPAPSQQGFGMNTRSIATIALGGVGVYFLYKFAKKNKWL